MISKEILVGDQRNLPAELPLGDSEGDEPLPLGWSELREEFVSIQLARESRCSRLVKAARSLAFYSVETLRYSLSTVLWVLFAAFLIVFVLQLPHPLAWDSWEGVILLQKTIRPLLALINAALNWPTAVFAYPLALAVLCLAT